MECQIRDKILQFDGRAPRYTSYPTAPHFKQLEHAFDSDLIFSPLPHGEAVSLYFHIPFCAKMCWYCGCHTKVTQRYEPIAGYVDLVLQELDIFARKAKDRLSVSHIHFGGGSPSLLKAHDFKRIMERVKTHFIISDDSEIAMEIDPRNVNEARVAAYAQYGVNRVSLGVQDFDETVLKAVNRQQPFHLSYEATQLFRSYGIDNINLDIMYGLPHQTIDSIKQTIEKSLLLNPDRIAFFGYAHVPWMKKHMRLIDEGALPEKDDRFDMFYAGSNILEDAGYKAVGIDHFVKAEDSMYDALESRELSRNFQGYTTDAARYMFSFGVSSIGQTPYFFMQNYSDMPRYKKYILDGELPIAKTCTIKSDDLLRARIISDLMCYFRADIGAICERYGFAQDTLDEEIKNLDTFVSMDFVKIDGCQITIKNDAKLIARVICSAFDAYLKPQMQKPMHAQAI